LQYRLRRRITSAAHLFFLVTGTNEVSGTPQAFRNISSGKDHLPGRTRLMNTLFTFMRYEMFFLLASLAAIVGYRLLTGRINTKGLLTDKVTHEFSPGRLQMLIATALVAIYFIVQVLETEKMPQLPQEFILALGGSHLLYLGGKTYSVLVDKLAKIAGRINP